MAVHRFLRVEEGDEGACVGERRIGIERAHEAEQPVARRLVLHALAVGDDRRTLRAVEGFGTSTA
ncbi:MAG: hypothetical protein U1F30_16350 [Steroidobacteraceae bacterium]